MSRVYGVDCPQCGEGYVGEIEYDCDETEQKFECDECGCKFHSTVSTVVQCHGVFVDKPGTLKPTES